MENEEQQLRKLHVVVDSLVIHRKGELHLLFIDLSFLCIVYQINLGKENISAQLSFSSFRVKQVV